MKTVNHRISASVRMSEVGSSIVSFKVDTSLPLPYIDATYVHKCIMNNFFPGVRYEMLYDGTFVAFADLSLFSTSDCSFSFDATVVLQDGNPYDVHFDFDYTNDLRHDLALGSTRVISLDGTAQILVNDENFSESE